ncbi:MAG: NAD+ synthase [Promethearchaeota archaeon]
MVNNVLNTSNSDETYYYKIKVGLAQINPTVGDLPGNRDKIIKYIEMGEKQNCDFIIFPELAVTGYPLQDLIFIHDFVDKNLEVIHQIKEHVKKSIVIVGCITKVQSNEQEKYAEKGEQNHSLTPFYNSAAIIYPNHQIHYVHKHLLPNYDVFDEKRYFSFSKDFEIFNFKGLKFSVEICEDLWDTQYQLKVTDELYNRGAQIIFNINASPYYIEKPKMREEIVKKHVLDRKIPLIYLNMVGGQDEITFDGRSMAYDFKGNAIARLPSFEEIFQPIEIAVPSKNEISELHDRLVGPEGLESKKIPSKINDIEEIYKALVLNLRDYFEKVGVFKKIVVGLSGGIDSSLTAAIACRAIGPENVIGILMPSRYSSDHSVNDAIQLCKNLGMQYFIVPIKKIHEIFEKELWSAFNINKFSLADENLQARIRGVILMYYSNKFSALLVSTGNKSEIATGYCTLYGDTNGGKNVPGDLYKMDVYALANWINEQSRKQGKGEIIPQNCIDKPPSAELRPNQKDQDSLPPYDYLDKILIEFIENDRSFEEIIKMGFDEQTVRKVEKMYYAAEFKRSQMAQTIKVRKKSFGIGRRIPIVNKYHITRSKI